MKENAEDAPGAATVDELMLPFLPVASGGIKGAVDDVVVVAVPANNADNKSKSALEVEIAVEGESAVVGSMSIKFAFTLELETEDWTGSWVAGAAFVFREADEELLDEDTFSLSE